MPKKVWLQDIAGGMDNLTSAEHLLERAPGVAVDELNIDYFNATRGALRKRPGTVSEGTPYPDSRTGSKLLTVIPFFGGFLLFTGVVDENLLFTEIQVWWWSPEAPSAWQEVSFLPAPGPNREIDIIPTSWVVDPSVYTEERDGFQYEWRQIYVFGVDSTYGNRPNEPQAWLAKRIVQLNSGSPPGLFWAHENALHPSPDFYPDGIVITGEIVEYGPDPNGIETDMVYLPIAEDLMGNWWIGKPGYYDYTSGGPFILRITFHWDADLLYRLGIRKLHIYRWNPERYPGIGDIHDTAFCLQDRAKYFYLDTWDLHPTVGWRTFTDQFGEYAGQRTLTQGDPLGFLPQEIRAWTFEWPNWGQQPPQGGSFHNNTLTVRRGNSIAWSRRDLSDPDLRKMSNFPPDNWISLPHAGEIEHIVSTNDQLHVYHREGIHLVRGREVLVGDDRSRVPAIGINYADIFKGGYANVIEDTNGLSFFIDPGGYPRVFDGSVAHHIPLRMPAVQLLMQWADTAMDRDTLFLNQSTGFRPTPPGAGAITEEIPQRLYIYHLNEAKWTKWDGNVGRLCKGIPTRQGSELGATANDPGPLGRLPYNVLREDEQLWFITPTADLQRFKHDTNHAEPVELYRQWPVLHFGGPEGLLQGVIFEVTLLDIEWRNLTFIWNFWLDGDLYPKTRTYGLSNDGPQTYRCLLTLNWRCRKFQFALKEESIYSDYEIQRIGFNVDVDEARLHE